MSENKTLKVARYRNSPYTVNYITNGGLKTYQWAPSKQNKTDIKSIPVEVVDWLLMNSVSFNEGELVIVDETDEAKEAISNIDDTEKYENNTHSRDDIVKILEGNFMKMKSELGKITVLQEKQYVVDVAKEIKLDSSSKQKFLAEWLDVPADLLFADEEKEE